jgi:hypothetical protein
MVTLATRVIAHHSLFVELHAQLASMHAAALISEEEFHDVLRGFRMWLWRHLGLATVACLI